MCEGKNKRFRKLGEQYNKTERLVLTAILFAAAIVLSIVEGMLPAIPISGVKFGLANIAVMYALFFFQTSSAFTIVLLKGIFVAITRGPIAGLLSFSGGLCSIFIMVLLIFMFHEKISYFLLSIFGGMFHNIGQYMIVTLIYKEMNLIAVLPILLISGIVAGAITSILLQFILPALQKRV